MDSKIFGERLPLPAAHAVQILHGSSEHAQDGFAQLTGIDRLIG